MRTYSFQGQATTTEDMAKLVLSQAEESQWFDDEPRPAGKEVLPVEEPAIQALRQARITVGRDLGYLGCSLPDRTELPLWGDLVALHRDLVKEKAIDSSVAGGFTLALVDSRLETLEKAQTLVLFLEARLTLRASLASSGLAWLDPLAKRLQAMPANGAALQTLLTVCRDIRDLENQRQELLVNAVEMPVEAELHPEFTAALARLVAGRSGFALPFGQRSGRQIIAAVTIGGLVPASQADWAIVQQTLDWRTGARKALARWTALSTEFGFPTPGSGLEAGFKNVCHWQAMVENLCHLVFEFDASLDSRVKEVFGSQTAQRMGDATEPWLATVLASLQAHLDKIRLAEAKQRVEVWLRGLEPRSGRIVEEIRAFLRASVGALGSDEASLEQIWLALQAELSRLTALQPALETITEVTGLIEVAGAERWARRLRTVVASAEQDPVTPTGWQAAWAWRLAVMFLDSIDGHHVLRDLFADRRTQALTLTRTYQELVAEKTWLGVFHNSPDRVRQALQAYLNAVQAMGSGKGIRAIRYRKDARHAMRQAYQAVPCWVLPQWRVSETLPAELGLFDLVIVDEASQSDIWALPALLRGKKLLVVGDHKQVSPSAVGVADRKIQELINRFLNNQPFGSEMTPEKSIYDLARVVFAGNSVMLKEHFRCVPAIIEFSNREFYENDIRALRVPKANERLDPPLIDIFVKGGFRQGDLNRPEAKAVVDELEAILLNPEYAGRSIGVVTLLGTQQAAHIHELVSARISPVDVVARRIAIGPPPVFQGRERDIMLVSMVLAPGDRAAANRADLHQRFNVALSRARDRMILFRSVGDAEFKGDTLNGRVLQHFKQPFRRDVHRVQALRERCESGFERDMFDELVQRGFRVEPQVPCGGYRIDFVVEGVEGRRLAVECDGDRFHGPGQWQDDMSRQRILERAGWTFWRCFASSFVRRRAAVIADLLQTLERLGIEPLGAESVDSTTWVQYREVDPFGVETEQEAVPT
jgi:very-short-patch-repair endonuclease